MKKVNLLNISLKNPFQTSTVMDLAFAQELLQPYLDKHIQLENCQYCSNIHRSDSWCSCEDSQSHKDKLNKGVL